MDFSDYTVDYSSLKESRVTMTDEEYKEYIKNEFDWIRDQITNHIPHKIDMIFWKILGTLLGLSGIIFLITRIINS